MSECKAHVSLGSAARRVLCPIPLRMSVSLSAGKSTITYLTESGSDVRDPKNRSWRRDSAFFHRTCSITDFRGNLSKILLLFLRFNKDYPVEAGAMTPLGKVRAIEPDGPSSTPRTMRQKESASFQKLSSDLHMSAVACALPNK